MDDWMPTPPHSKDTRAGKRWQIHWTIDRLEERGMPEDVADELHDLVDAGEFDDL